VATPIAEELAKKQKEISVAEFFERNKQILGFDSLTRAMLTSVKEAVDNSLDVCEEANLHPEILVEIRPDKKVSNEYTIIVEDNGPGITKNQIPHVFGRLLYGSRFHAIRQSRGQQGIGISAVVMYGQLTTGKPTVVKSKIGDTEGANVMTLIMDTKRNRADVMHRDVVLWDEVSHGTRVEITIQARYQRERKQGVLEYLRATAIVNPHAKIVFREPDGKTTVFERVTDQLPTPTKEIKPHPKGIELGTLMRMAKATSAYKLNSFLVNEFASISIPRAKELCERAGLNPSMKPKRMKIEDARALIEAFHSTKLISPPTDCLSPIGDLLIKKGLKKEIDTKFAYTTTRPPSVFSGNPFQVEVGLVYGGDLEKDTPIKILRFANRVPLLYQQGGCVTTHAIESVNWRPYGLEQRGGRGIPVGPVTVLVHVASTNVPFTSESKEAIADIPEIQSEIELAIRECARKMKSHINRKAKLHKMQEKFELIQKVLPAIADKTSSLLDKERPAIDRIISKIMNLMMVTDEITYETVKDGVSKETITKVKISVTNYTIKSKGIHLLCKIPDALIQHVSPKQSKQYKGLLEWDIKAIEPSESIDIQFEILGLEKGEWDENEIYYRKVKGDIIGAMPVDEGVINDLM